MQTDSSANRFLSTQQIETVRMLCNQFRELFQALFPDRSLTQKMHELIFTVPKFVKIHHTLGKLSGEEGESLHSSVNQELRQLACVRDQAERLMLVLGRQELRATVDKSLLKGVARLCVNCKVK